MLRHQFHRYGNACGPDRDGRLPQDAACPWLRRLITRGIAIIPAAGVTIAFGESGTSQLLILTQVVLSLQLSFAVFPLVMFTADRAKMGELCAPRWLSAFAWFIAIVIAALNVKLLFDFVG